MCGPRASGITPYGCSSVTVLYMSQPLSASHCLVYLRIPQLNLTSGFGSISLLSTPLCYIFTCINCYFAWVKLNAYLQGLGSLNAASLYIAVLPPGSLSPWNRSRTCMLVRITSQWHHPQEYPLIMGIWRTNCVQPSIALELLKLRLHNARLL